MSSNPTSLREEALHHARSAVSHAKARGDLNAFITLADPDELSIASLVKDGPLLGMPIAVKDNIDVAGMPCTAGTPRLRDWHPSRSAVVIDRIRRAGGVVIGKTNMHELAAGVTSNNLLYGPVRNPHAPELIAGGSSGGSAVAVAAEIVEVALGTDTAGSCRIPAALSGCVGFRPTIGRYPLDGVLPLSTTRDTVGILARTVDQVTAFDRVLGSGPLTNLGPASPVRVGIPRGYFYRDLESELSVVIDTALDKLADAGVELIETEVEAIEEVMSLVSLPSIIYDALRDWSTYLNRHRSSIHAWEILDAMAGPERFLLDGELSGSAISDDVHRDLLATHRPRLIDAYRRCFERDRLDALVVPTTPVTARPIGCEDTIVVDGAEVPTLFTYLRNTDPTAFAGLPSICLPAGKTAGGLPVGISFDSLPGRDHALLAAARVFESILL